ncbi:hypothetical protein [Bartonella mastomydis]|uniref:hypothetical protein n=1 Tax=Bartonella mastomydis TaxID=1820002 RepID=UPI001117086A|nr:hypothetical protein [Bartonella mastomydis]
MLKNPLLFYLGDDSSKFLIFSKGSFIQEIGFYAYLRLICKKDLVYRLLGFVIFFKKNRVIVERCWTIRSRGLVLSRWIVERWWG